MLAVHSGVRAMSPMLSFDLSMPSVAALLQEDESIFNMLGCLLPEAQHVEHAPTMQQMPALQAEENSLETTSDLGRSDAGLAAAHQPQKQPLPSPDASPSRNTGKTSSGAQDTYIGAVESSDAQGMPPALVQLSGSVQQPPACNPASISHSPFASHPWSYSLSSGDTKDTTRTASLPNSMPALPAPHLPIKSRACSTPQVSLATATGRCPSFIKSALRMPDEDTLADLSGGSNNSHMEHQTAPVCLDGSRPTEDAMEKMRIKRIQDKNRRNQHRFRARQRARLEDAEQKAKELSRQVRELERHNAELAACNRQLEGKTSSSTAASIPAPAQPHSTRQEPGTPKKDTADFCSLSAFVSKVLGEPFSWEQARDMTFKDISEAMRMYHATLKQLFERDAEEPGSAAHAELLQLLALKKESEFQRWQCRPHVIHMQYAMMNEADGDYGGPRLAKWQSILAAMQLTPEQTSRLLEAHTYLLARLTEIIQSRKSIISMLKGSVPSLEDGRQQHVRYLKASAAADCLQRNVDAEHTLYTDFLLAFWQVAMPLQQAKCEMLAFPWTPDVLAMFNLLAACATINVNSEPTRNAQNMGS